VVAYQLVIRKKALEFVNALPSKSQRIVIERCKTLADTPFPGQGDKELVKILDIMTIKQAHKIYGRF
jgi:hypothetical protein